MKIGAYGQGPLRTIGRPEEDRKSRLRWVWCGVMLCVGVGAWMVGSDAWAKAPSVKFRKPIFTYLGLETQRRLSDEKLDVIEGELRGAIEKGRFIYLKIGMGQGREGLFVRRMVKVVAARSMGIARMRAQWDSQFQGYKITSNMLESIQNQSFYYWLEVSKLKAVRRSRTKRYHMTAKMHIRQLNIFDCSPANRKRSARHDNACRDKKNSEFAGFAKPFKIITANTEGISRSLERLGTRSGRQDLNILRDSARAVGKGIFQKLASIREFQLHAPIERATFSNVYVPMGKAEDLKLNQGFNVYVRHIRGHLMYRGYVRIRKLGDNRMVMKGNRRVRKNASAPFYSEAQPLIVSGGSQFQKGMLLYENPTYGVGLSVFAGLMPVAHESFALESANMWGVPLPLLKGTTLIPAVRVEGEIDSSNALGFNEVYVNFFLGIGLGGNNDSDNFVLPFMLGFGLLKKFYFRQLAWVVGARINLGYLSNDPHSSGALNAFLIGGEALTGIEFMISPKFSLGLRVGFRGATSLAFNHFSLGPWAMLGGTYTF